MLNIPLAVGMVDVQVGITRFDADLARVRQRLAALPSFHNIGINVNRAAATNNVNLLMQQVQALRKQAEAPIRLAVARRGSLLGAGGAGGGGGGGGSFLGGAGRIAGGIVLGRGLSMAAQAPGDIAGAMFAAAKKAADLGESLSKVNVSFGPAAKGIIGKVDELADRFGVVKKDALEAAANFGLMGMASGQTKEQAAALGTEFVQMGLDIASFHNISNEEAFAKLRSGLAGEIEPLRTIGILLSEDAVQARALAMGLVATKKEATHLTQAQKVQVRTVLIREGMGPAAGDIERTADSSANLMRKMAGDWENAVTSFGKELEGALRSGMALAGELAGMFKKMTGEDTSKVVGGWTKAGIDAVRAGTGGGGKEGGITYEENKELAALNFMDPMGVIGGKTGARRKELKAKLEAYIAQFVGMPLEAGPSTPEERKAAMKNAPEVVKAPVDLANDQVIAFNKAMADAALGNPAIGLPGAGLGMPGLAMARAQDIAQAAPPRVPMPLGGRGGTAFAIEDTEQSLKLQDEIVRKTRAAANARGQDDAARLRTKAALIAELKVQETLERSLAEMRAAPGRRAVAPVLAPGAAGGMLGPGLAGMTSSSLIDMLGAGMGDVGPGLMEKMAKNFRFAVPMREPSDARTRALALAAAVPEKKGVGVAISGEEMLARFQEEALTRKDDVGVKQLAVQEKTLTAVEMLGAAMKQANVSGVALLP